MTEIEKFWSQQEEDFIEQWQKELDEMTKQHEMRVRRINRKEKLMYVVVASVLVLPFLILFVMRLFR